VQQLRGQLQHVVPQVEALQQQVSQLGASLREELQHTGLQGRLEVVVEQVGSLQAELAQVGGLREELRQVQASIGLLVERLGRQQV
jgi:prefoldin subunit 5